MTLLSAKISRIEPPYITSLSELIVIQLMSSQPAECSVLLEQLQGMIVQPPANQEPWKARRQEEQGADVSHLIHTHPSYTQRASREQAPNGKDVRHLRVFSTLHFSTQALKATLQLSVFDLTALILKSFENWLVVLDPEGMVQSLKLGLLPGTPEMTDKELAWEKVHQDKNQVVGKGREGYQEQWNRLHQVSAKLSEFLHVSVGQILELQPFCAHLYFYVLHFVGIFEQ